MEETEKVLETALTDEPSRRDSALVRIIHLCCKILSERSIFQALHKFPDSPDFSRLIDPMWEPTRLLQKVTPANPLSTVIQNLWDQVVSSYHKTPVLSAREQARYWSYESLKQVALLATKAAHHLPLKHPTPERVFYWLDILCLYQEGLALYNTFEETTRRQFIGPIGRMLQLSVLAQHSFRAAVPALAASVEEGSSRDYKPTLVIDTKAPRPHAGSR